MHKGSYCEVTLGPQLKIQYPGPARPGGASVTLRYVGILSRSGQNAQQAPPPSSHSTSSGPGMINAHAPLNAITEE